MPSKSKAQQRFMGMVHALNKGEMKPSDASPAVKKAAKSMDTKSTKKYASTTHKGKPEKVNKEWIVKTIKELTNTEMEACGYTTSAVDPNYKLKSPGGTGNEDKQLKEGEKEKIVQLLIKRGNTEQDAQNMVNKSYDYIKKAYRKTTPAKKAEIMSYLSKYESTEQWGNLVEKCWKGYEKKGTKKMFGKTYPNCVKKESVNEAYGLSEMKMSEIDKLIKSKIKDVARKDRKRGMELMNLYKKHWIEFMLKTKDLLSKESLSLVNPIRIKKQTKDLGEGILNEMDYRGFIKYMNDFYGPKGVYPDKKKRTLGQKEIGMAYSVLLKKKPNFEIGFDSTDREMLRDILIKLRKLDPDYSKKESVNEGKGVEKILKMADDQSFGKLGGRTVDAMSANLFKQVYDKAPQNAKDKINKMNEKQLYIFMTKLWSKFGRQVRL